MNVREQSGHRDTGEEDRQEAAEVGLWTRLQALAGHQVDALRPPRLAALLRQPAPLNSLPADLVATLPSSQSSLDNHLVVCVVVARVKRVQDPCYIT